MNKTKITGTEAPREIHLGPITLFYEQEPPLLTTKEQAQIVGRFLAQMDDRAGYETSGKERFLELEHGKIEAVFQQYSESAVEEMKRKMIHYDEIVLNSYLLSPEEQLQNFFLSVRA